MKNLFKLTMLGLVLLAFSVPAWSLWGSQASLEGTVQNIQANIITLTDNSAMGAEGQSVSVEVDEATEYDQLASLDELAVGDKIEIKYKEEEGKKIATKVSMLENSESDAAVPGAVGSQEPEASGQDGGESAAPAAPAPSY